MKLICFDMDGIFLKERNFWLELHKAFDTYKQGKIYTEKYLHEGYDILVQKVVGELWKGKNANAYYDLIQSAVWIDGAQDIVDYCKQKGLITAIVSASALGMVRHVSKVLGGIDHLYGNDLVIKDGKINGAFIACTQNGYEHKKRVIENLARSLQIDLSEVAFIGDQKIDVAAAQSVGIPIAFNSESEELSKTVKYDVRGDSLTAILPYLRKELEE